MKKEHLIMAFKINNNFYDNITIYDVDYNEIFHGNGIRGLG